MGYDIKGPEPTAQEIVESKRSTIQDVQQTGGNKVTTTRTGTPAVLAQSTLPTLITAIDFGGTRYYSSANVHVDDVAVFNRVLTATEITDIYDGTWPITLGGNNWPIMTGKKFWGWRYS